MRERLVATLVGLTLAVISLFGIPRAYLLADLVREHETARIETAAVFLTALVAERRESGGEVDEDVLEHGLTVADAVEYVDADGRSIAVGRPVVRDEGAIVETRQLADGSRLSLSRSGASVQAKVGDAVRPLVLLGLLLAGAAAVLGFVLARRLSRPFRELAETARELGHGRFDIAVPSYSVPEADAIGSALHGAAGRLDQLVRREREFAVNASHQLRTPITALKLQLEDLTLWPETAPQVREELEAGLVEIDRLNSAIDELLDLSRGQRRGDASDVDLSGLVEHTVQRWRPQVEAGGRRVLASSPGAVPARLQTGPVVQVLDVLVDNARLHGEGAITVETRDEGTHLAVVVSDEGTAHLRPDIFHRGVSTGLASGEGHGVGLAVASELAEICGGHLSIDAGAPTTTFVLMLPRPGGARPADLPATGAPRSRDR